MAFNNSREGSNRSNKKSFGARKTFGDRSGRDRDSGRDPNRFNHSNRDVKLTKVICSSCGKTTEVPFKPTSNKPVYCRDCFSKDGKSHQGSNNNSSKELKEINEKLDKIMKELKIE